MVAMPQSKLGEAQHANIDLLLPSPGAAGVLFSVISGPTLALKSHKRKSGVHREALRSLCCSPALFALWDPFWFSLRHDAILWLLRKGLALLSFCPSY